MWAGTPHSPKHASVTLFVQATATPPAPCSCARYSYVDPSRFCSEKPCFFTKIFRTYAIELKCVILCDYEKHKSFRKARTAISGLLPPTIYLNRMRVRRSKNAAFVGRLSNFIVNWSKQRVSISVKVVSIVGNAIILPAVCGSGWVWRVLRVRRVKPFTASKKVYSMITYDEKSKNLLLLSTLRKSYVQI